MSDNREALKKLADQVTKTLESLLGPKGRYIIAFMSEPPPNCAEDTDVVWMSNIPTPIARRLVAEFLVQFKS